MPTTIARAATYVPVSISSTPSSSIGIYDVSGGSAIIIKNDDDVNEDNNHSFSSDDVITIDSSSIMGDGGTSESMYVHQHGHLNLQVEPDFKNRMHTLLSSSIVEANIRHIPPPPQFPYHPSSPVETMEVGTVAAEVDSLISKPPDGGGNIGNTFDRPSDGCKLVFSRPSASAACPPTPLLSGVTLETQLPSWSLPCVTVVEGQADIIRSQNQRPLQVQDRQQHEDETLKDDASTDPLEGALPVYDEHQTLPVLMHFDGIGEGGDAFSSSCVAPSTTKIVFSPSATNMASLHNKATPTLPPQLLNISCIDVKSTNTRSCCYNHDVPPSTPLTPSFTSRDGLKNINSPLYDNFTDDEPVRLFEVDSRQTTTTTTPCLVGTLRKKHLDRRNKKSCFDRHNEDFEMNFDERHEVFCGDDGGGMQRYSQSGRDAKVYQLRSPKKPSSTASSPRHRHHHHHIQNAPRFYPNTTPPKLFIALGISGVLVYANKGSKIRKLKALPNRPPDAHLQITSTNRPSVVPETISVYYRPHIAHFITTLMKHFDIAIFSTGEQDYVDALLDVMDPSGQAFPKLRRYYRHNCTKIVSRSSFEVASEDQRQLSSGVDRAQQSTTHLAKDLHTLGTPLNEVILIDDTQASGILQPNNLLLLPTWTGDPSDTALLQLSNTLSHIAKCRQ